MIDPSISERLYKSIRADWTRANDKEDFQRWWSVVTAVDALRIAVIYLASSWGWDYNAPEYLEAMEDMLLLHNIAVYRALNTGDVK